MTVPIDVRQLAIAIRNARRRIERNRSSIEMNVVKLREWGYGDVDTVLSEIYEEERVKPSAVMPPSAEASDHA